MESYFFAGASVRRYRIVIVEFFKIISSFCVQSTKNIKKVEKLSKIAQK
jgi:hypothetical protein